ncbi:MAG TPA: hypothetical protein V6D03_14985 [Candidatus Caenarcaniphilales bacterium]
MSSSPERSPHPKTPHQDKPTLPASAPDPGAGGSIRSPQPESQSANKTPEPPGLSLQRPPQRPSKASPETAAVVIPDSSIVTPDVADFAEVGRSQPIPPPSEPMQYRAIGLVRGRYQPSEEQFNRGTLLTMDGTQLDAVLLGRVMSLVKKHLDLKQEHLWVVYPRTRDNQPGLHLQILGVWEPEELHQNQQSASTMITIDSGAATPLVDGYFSIRGEMIYQSQDPEYVVIKIQQSPRKASEKAKFFKLRLAGVVQQKAIGYFWDLNVKRQANNLVIEKGNSVAAMPPKKPKKSTPGSKRSPIHKQKFSKPVRTGQDKHLPANSAGRQEPASKPIKPNLRRTNRYDDGF